MQILHNAKIYTQDRKTPTATALVIDDHAPLAGRILAIGSDTEILDSFSHRAKIQDMQGAVILPGLTDAHIHFRYYAHSLSKIDIFEASKAETLRRVAERAKNSPPGKWVLGHGFNQNNWAEGFPTASDLDEVAPNNPVLLTSASLHSAWCNTVALKTAGITVATPDPKNGRIGRKENGEPDGMLFETSEHLVSKFVPKPSLHDDMEAMKVAQKQLWQYGLTGIHDFDRISCFKALQELHKSGDLKLRVSKTLPLEQLEPIIESGIRTGFGDDLLRIGGIKVFADGALGPQTAAMLEGYELDKENVGMLFLDGEEFFEKASMAANSGLSMTVHAIGDQANHEMLKGFDQLRKYEKANHLPHLRHRIEHVQLLHPDDFDKFSNLDIIASMQPIHATDDMDMADKYWGERAQNSYAWQTLKKKGARLAFGSDAPVDSPNPFWGIHAAVTRQRPDGYPNLDGWQSNERLSVEDAIAGYTTRPAFAAEMESHLGKLGSGYLADLIVLNDDPYTCDPTQLREIKPQATMVGGDWVWGQFN